MKYLLMLAVFLVGCNQSGPSILIVGDSISLGYTPYVQAMVPNVKHNGQCFKAPFVHTAEQDNNAEWSAHGAACMDTWLSQGNYDIVHFNAGMWDLLGCHNSQGITPLSDYLRNLQEELDAIRAHGAKPIFATTTPVLPGNRQCVDPEMVKTYNAAAKEMMESQGVEVDDLYAYMLPYQVQYHKHLNIHFTDLGYEFIAKQVASVIAE